MLRASLVVLGVAAIPAGILLGRPLRVELPPAEQQAAEPLGDSLSAPWDSITAQLIERDPFRADRKPAAVPYNSISPEQVLSEPAPPKPVLSVSGIVWGDEPSAVIEGLPGVEGGKLMRPGESIAGITLRRITKDQVILRGLDTTWMLNVRKPW